MASTKNDLTAAKNDLTAAKNDLTAAWRFTSADTAQAILYLPESCATITVNARHRDIFQSVVDVRTDTTPQAVVNVIDNVDQPPEAPCHCERIAAIDVLDTSHCIVEDMYHRTDTSGRAQQGINFLRARQGKNEQGQLARTYHACVVDGDLISDERAHAYGVQMEPAPRVTLTATTLQATEHSVTLEYRALLSEREWRTGTLTNHTE